MRLSELVRLALEEDVGNGDLTTEATVPAERRGVGLIRAKQALVVCGHVEAAEVFRQVGAIYRPLVGEGCAAASGEVVAEVEGPLRALLTGERVALNLLMRLSGIASHTRRVIGDVQGLAVVDTRKTTPLLRGPERRAVRVGGGRNHRFALYDGILIKDNHIVAAGGITPAVRAARAAAHHLRGSRGRSRPWPSSTRPSPPAPMSCCSTTWTTRWWRSAWRGTGARPCLRSAATSRPPACRRSPRWASMW